MPPKFALRPLVESQFVNLLTFYFKKLPKLTADVPALLY